MRVDLSPAQLVQGIFLANMLGVVSVLHQGTLAHSQDFTVVTYYYCHSYPGRRKLWAPGTAGSGQTTCGFSIEKFTTLMDRKTGGNILPIFSDILYTSCIGSVYKIFWFIIRVLLCPPISHPSLGM